MEELSANNTNLTNLLEDNVLSRLEAIACNFNIFITTVGTTTNFLSIYSFLQKKLLIKKINWYFLVLTIFEFIFCFLVFFDYTFTKIHYDEIFFHDFHDSARIVFDYLIHTSQSCIAILSLLLSLDRLYAIKNPLFIKEFVTQNHCKKLIALSLLLLVLIKTSSFVFCEYSKANISFIICAILVPLLLSTIPLIGVFVLNFLLIKEIIKSYRQTSLSVSVDYGNHHEQRSSINDTKMIQKSKRQNTIITQTSYECNDDKQPSSSNMKENNDKDDSKDESDSLRNNSLQLPEPFSLRRSNNRELKNSQKSHYFLIICTNVWSIITSIPYSIFNYYLAYTQLFTSPDLIDLKTTISCQIVSSVLYNSNHCFNFFIYFFFYADFRGVMKNLFSGLLKYFLFIRNYIREMFF